MDTVTHYQQILEELLQQYSHKPSHGDIEPEIIIDIRQAHVGHFIAANVLCGLADRRAVE